MDVKGVSAIVTGGASGLGGATAAMLAEQGAKVAIFDLNEEAGKAFAAKVAGAFFKVNVADDASVEQAVAAAQEAHGVARILVNCAGVVIGGKTVGREAKPHPLDSFRTVIEVNLIGTFNVVSKVAARLSLAPLLGEERGVIINTASIAAFEGQIGQAAYAASKAGVAGLTLPAARELAKSGIRVVTIAPGLFMTPMMAAFPAAVQESLAQAVPFPPRLGKPEEYAQMVATICELTMLNGETIRLDGALRMAPK